MLRRDLAVFVVASACGLAVAMVCVALSLGWLATSLAMVAPVLVTFGVAFTYLRR